MAKQLLKPIYFDKFKCIGTACEDTCCTGWGVTVDKPTYKKYKKVKSSDFSKKLDSNVVRNKSSNHEATYAKMKMVDNCCSFLTEDSLCEIQMNLGEKFLCHTCSTYPRDFNKVNDLLELSLTPSCPEATRLILNQPDGLDFEMVENHIKDIKYYNKNIKTKCENIDWEIRIFCIHIIQNRKISLENRLIILGLFVDKLGNLTRDQTEETSILKLMSTFDELMKSNEYISSLNELPPNYEFQIKIAIDIIESRIENGGIFNERYIECLNVMIETFEIGEFDLKRQVEIYKEISNELYLPKIHEYSIYFENYLVNELYTKQFPISSNDKEGDYLILVIKFLLVRLHVLSFLKLKKVLDINDFVMIIQSLSKVSNHSPSFLKKIVSLFEEANFNSMAHMAILIKQ